MNNPQPEQDIRNEYCLTLLTAAQTMNDLATKSATGWAQLPQDTADADRLLARFMALNEAHEALKSLALEPLADIGAGVVDVMLTAVEQTTT